MSHPEEDKKIIIDEDWKSQVQAEKEALEKAEDVKADSEESEGAVSESSEPEASAASADSAAEQSLPPLPPASFTQLLTMFATQASVSLQQGANREDEQRGEHLMYAKHFIDLLAVVEAKTQGNLTDEEAKMLENLLHELRMAYVSLNR